tara:strand:- start:10629 stop:11756 length:1128 start_codon:yes stop_codon:yes gene_type:complete
MSAKPNIVIASTNKSKFSETFIHDQVEYLPANVHYIHTNSLPTKYGHNEKMFLDNTFISRFKIWFRKKYLNQSQEYILKDHIKKYLLKNNIELVLAQYGPVGVEIMDICKSTNIPLIVYFHGFDAYRNDILEAYSQRYKKLFNIAKNIFVVSHDMDKQIKTLGAPSEKIIYNPCGVNPSKFSYIDPSKNPSNFLYVGRFVEKKNPIMAIRAFNEVYKSIPESKLFLVGDGILKTKSEELVNFLKLNEAVIFMGIQPHNQIHKLISKSRAFIQSSICPKSGDKEGTPVSIMEASFSGLPIISTKHGGIVDVVIDKKSGFLVDEDDYKSMAKYMIQLSKDSSLATAMGKLGNKHIKEHFTLNKNIDTIWSTIQEIIH